MRARHRAYKKPAVRRDRRRVRHLSARYLPIVELLFVLELLPSPLAAP